MRQFIQGIFSLGILSTLTVGCFKGEINNVKVEQVAQLDAGVVLDPITAKAYTVPIDDQVYTVKPTSMAEVASAVLMKQKAEAAVLQPVVEPILDPAVHPVASYLYVSNSDVADALKEKLGTNYTHFSELYSSTIANHKSLGLIPQLNMVYQFRAKIDASHRTDYISFPLYQVFAGYGVFIRLNGDHYDTFWGPGILSQKLSNAKVAAGMEAPLVANLFALTPKFEIFKSTDANFFAFEKVSGGNIFGINFSGHQFALNALAANLPDVANTDLILSKRVDSDLVAKLGSTVKLNGRVFYYADAKSIVSHIYFMGSDFLFKELKGQCDILAGAKLLPSELKCN